MATTEALARAKKKYAQTHIKSVALKVHREKESDILEKLESVENVQQYLKDLIRKDINAQK